jgi:hypothetical protein
MERQQVIWRGIRNPIVSGHLVKRKSNPRPFIAAATSLAGRIDSESGV